VTIFTVGFTGTSAERFFRRLTSAKPSRLVDVRLNNVSQLAGFAKKQDLDFFTGAIVGIPYEHRLELAPTQELLSRYRRDRNWPAYEGDFLELMQNRHIESLISPAALDRACLLCTEPTAEKCHRRLVAEYLSEKWGGIDVVHL
jgi:uncharacterized protein (DUF488 family)